MHEVSLGGMIRDYLTGASVQQTMYEDLRQALARMLVEEFSYPASCLQAKLPLPYVIADAVHERMVDLVVYSCVAGLPKQAMLLILFCAGQVNTYAREALSLARLFPDRGCPLILVTDTRDFVLYAAADGSILASGAQAVPLWRDLPALAAKHPVALLTREQREKESRILHTYSAFLKECCTECVSL